MPIQAAIVDLDGTLVDTVGDFDVALNAMLSEHGLPVVGEHFDEVFVDEDSQLNVRALGEVREGEWRLGGPQSQRAGLGPEQDRQTAAFAVGKQGKAKEFPLRLGARDGDPEFDGVAVQGGDLRSGGRNIE